MEERGGMKRIGRKGGQAGCLSDRPEHAALAADSSYFTILAYFVNLQAGCLIRQGVVFNGVVREAVPGRLAQAQPGVCMRASASVWFQWEDGASRALHGPRVDRDKRRFLVQTQQGAGLQRERRLKPQALAFDAAAQRVENGRP